MAFSVFLVVCAAGLAFMVRFLIALEREMRQVVVCRPVPVYQGIEGGSRSRGALGSSSNYGNVRWMDFNSTGIAGLSYSDAQK